MCNFFQKILMWNFDPKILIFGAISQFFVLESRFLSTGHITSIPGDSFPIWTNPNKFLFLSYGLFSGAHPSIWSYWDQFFDFSFPSYSRFRKKNPADAPKKSSPLWRHCLLVTALALDWITLIISTIFIIVTVTSCI